MYSLVKLLELFLIYEFAFNTFQVLFMDSLKEFITLYGHNLPVLCMDISSDGDLLVTGSADKNLKIWGLDFGDCHKSLFAHADRYFSGKFQYRIYEYRWLSCLKLC